MSTTSSNQARSTSRPAMSHRQRDVLGGGERRDQVERLEDEADPVAAELRELRSLRWVRSVSPIQTRARGGLVEAGHAVQQRRLARARGAHDRRVLAGCELHGHAAECLHRSGALAEDLPKIDRARGSGSRFREQADTPSNRRSRGAYVTDVNELCPRASSSRSERRPSYVETESRESIASATSPGSNGLVITASAPSERQRSRARETVTAVRTRTGTSSSSADR